MPTQICCSRLRFIHCAMVSPFILPCFPFSLIDEWKGEKLLKSCWWSMPNGLHLLHHTNGQMHVCLIASSVIIINKHNVFLCSDSSLISCWDLHIRMFLGCNLPIQLLLKSLSSTYEQTCIPTYTYMFSYLWSIIQLLLCVNNVVNPFTAKDTIWHPGVITHPELNILIRYKFHYGFCHPVHY